MIRDKCSAEKCFAVTFFFLQLSIGSFDNWEGQAANIKIKRIQQVAALIIIKKRAVTALRGCMYEPPKIT